MMASHEQVKRNVKDVNAAWGHFQGLIHSQLPNAARGVDAWSKIMNTKGRYS